MFLSTVGHFFIRIGFVLIYFVATMQIPAINLVQNSRLKPIRFFFKGKSLFNTEQRAAV